MLIDWFTVGAQALNFLVLVWLLKRFLYQPVLHAITAREERVAAALADADARQAAAAASQLAFERKHDAFDHDRAALLATATEAAQAQGARLLDDARAAAAAASAQRAEALQTEARALNQALARRTQDVVFQIARRALTDLATTSLEARLGEVLTRRLGELSEAAKTSFAQALQATTEPALVRSAFALPAPVQAALQGAIDDAFATKVPLRFEVTPRIISGIELSCGGHKVGWSIAHYLTALELGVAELLDAAPPAPPEPAPPAAPAAPRPDEAAPPAAPRPDEAAPPAPPAASAPGAA